MGVCCCFTQLEVILATIDIQLPLRQKNPQILTGRWRNPQILTQKQEGQQHAHYLINVSRWNTKNLIPTQFNFPFSEASVVAARYIKAKPQSCTTYHRQIPGQLLHLCSSNFTFSRTSVTRSINKHYQKGVKVKKKSWLKCILLSLALVLSYYHFYNLRICTIVPMVQ